MTFPTLPMGNLMAIGMLVTAAGLIGLRPDRSHFPALHRLRIGIGVLAATCAVWQLAWYASRHPGTFWGAMATASGLALGAAAVLLLAGRGRRATGYLRWPVALALLGLGLHYGVTIINL